MVRLLLLVSSLVVGLGLGELLIRFAGEADLDGNIWIGWRRVKPYKMPIKTVGEAIKVLQDPRRQFVYDSDVGWLPKPGLRAPPYFHDARGLRVGELTKGDRTATLANTVKIGFFGDSFIYGAQVPFEDSLGSQLQLLLETRGLEVAVSNYGVSGYGLDQAFLRWRKQGIAEDCVILGLPRVDAARTLNIVKALYMGYLWKLTPENTFPFTKPRFILERERLRLLNQPALSPEDLTRALANPSSWPLFKYESFYTVSDYRDTWFRRSKLFSFVADVVGRNRWTYSPGSIFWNDDDSVLFADGPARGILLGIIDAFATEVAARGAHFSILYVPEIDDVQRQMKGQALDIHYGTFLRLLKHSYPVVDPTDSIVATARHLPVRILFTPDFHYSRHGAALIAHAIRDTLPARCTGTAPARAAAVSASP